MASYTMELRTYIEKWSQWDKNVSIRDKIEKGRTRLFDFDYPIFDKDYKKIFETHFIRHFYMREIGSETEELFKFRLETWLLINMPYFNKLFESELIEFDPLANSMTEVVSKKSNDKNQTSKTKNDKQSVGNGTTKRDSFSRDIESDTPDSRLAITTKDGKGVIEYASRIDETSDNATNSSNNSETSSSNTNASRDINETEDFIQVRMGKTGSKSYSKMINEYRDSFIRIENRIFNEMQELFMLVY